MREEKIKQLLEDVKSGTVSTDEAFMEIKKVSYEDLGYAKVDHHRQTRNGFPEVIFCQGKTVDQVNGIVSALMKAKNKNILATRASREIYEGIKEIAPNCVYHETARIVVVPGEEEMDAPKSAGTIAIITAGTADIPVAEEAAITAETLGNKVDRIYDVGVAGIHRLFAQIDRINAAKVVIVVAGMEGALASVVGGLVDSPVVAVPTSVGYGASFEGLSALLTMLNSCASGIGVVNIDNGFGAGYLASTILRIERTEQ
jgi:NCAIR mutase (PurE)-related protein